MNHGFNTDLQMYDTDCNGIIEEPELVAGLAEAGEKFVKLACMLFCKYCFRFLEL